MSRCTVCRKATLLRFVLRDCVCLQASKETTLSNVFRLPLLWGSTLKDRLFLWEAMYWLLSLSSSLSLTEYPTELRFKTVKKEKKVFPFVNIIDNPQIASIPLRIRLFRHLEFRHIERESLNISATFVTVLKLKLALRRGGDSVGVGVGLELELGA